MCVCRHAVLPVLLAAAVHAQVRPISITVEGVTPTQAVFSYDVPGSSACTISVSELATPAVPVHDVDPMLFGHADQDLARSSTVANGTERFVTIGARAADVAGDGRLYSRALQADTDHMFTASCGRDVGRVSFRTQNPPLGNTYPEEPPFNPAGFGNYAWPTVDWTDSSKTYVDPMTGLLLKAVYGADPQGQTGQWGLDVQDWPFPDVFDLNQAWKNASNIAAAPGSGSLATYSGTTSDPLFLPFPPFPNRESTIAGWLPAPGIWDDVRLSLNGYGSDADAENRKVLACVAALFVPATNKCTGAEVELTLPFGSAGTVTSPGFPQFYFGAWKLGRFLNRDEASIPWGMVSVTNSVVTWKSGQLFPLTAPAGVKIKIGNSWYTLASLDNAAQLTLAEPSVTLGADASYQFGGFGIRIRKKTGAGIINVNASWTLAWARIPDMGYDGVPSLCSSLTFPVDRQADGVTPLDPPQDGRLCMLGTSTTRLVLLIPSTGETRVLSALNHNDAGSSTFPLVPPGAFSSTDPFTIFGLHGDDVIPTPRGTLYRITYDPSVCHFRTWPGNHYGFSSPAADDCLTWTNLTPASQGRDVIDQFHQAVSGNPFWNPGVMAQLTPAFSGLSGNYAVFSQAFDGPQNTPCFMATFDLDTGNLVQVSDSFGGASPTMRWGGCHSIPYATMGKWVSASLLNLGGGGYLGGPFAVRSIDSLSKDGGTTWSNDTSLTNVDGGPCTTADPDMIAKGAVGTRCIKIRISSDYPCNVAPANGDAAQFPCPWNSAFAGPMAIEVGDYISDLGNWYQNGSIPGKAEKMLVTSKTDIGAGNWELELMRWATCDDLVYYSHLLSPYVAEHANGWAGYMTGTAMCAGVVGWIDASDTSHKFYPDNRGDGHGTLGPAPGGMIAMLVERGAARVGPFPDQLNMPYNFVQNLTTTVFDGVTRNSDTDVQSYPNLTQWTASDAEKEFAFDLRHLNPSAGWGPERPAGIWPQNYVLIPGLKQVYKIDNYGAVFGKVFPYLAFAGRYLLKDMSGPASLIGDKDQWRFCVAYQGGECRPGSAANDVFVNVPEANVAQSCIVNTYALNSPCFSTPYAYGAWAVQYRYTRDDPNGKNMRRLTMGFTGPGRQYQFENVRVTPEGRWAFLGPGWVDGARSNLMMVKVPPPPADDQIDRTTFIPHQVDIASDGVSSYARVRFGYAENGPVDSFFCTSRQESCVTDQTIGPFAYESSDPLTPAACGSDGCSLSVPVLPGHVQYYQVERLNDYGTVISRGPIQVYAAP